MTLGSAIIDYHRLVDDQELAQITTAKGGWKYVNYNQFQSYIEGAVSDPHPGGSAINLAKGMNRLGVRCKVIGQAGSDEEGSECIRQLEKEGILTFFSKGQRPTGRSMCFVTPDGQSTMRTYAGAAHEISSLELSLDDFSNVKVFHVEGYQVLDPTLIERSMQLAKRAGAKVSFDLGSSFLVKQCRSFMLKLIDNYVDILFANESEFTALTNDLDYLSAETVFSGPELLVITQGKEGGYIRSGTTIFRYPAKKVEYVLDTTGSGDLFACGFLYGYIHDFSIQSCAELGASLGARVIQQVGSNLSDADWQELRRSVSLSL